MTKRTDYPSNIEIAPEVSEEEDRAGFHEAAFLAALQGLCANPHTTKDAVERYKRDREMRPAELLVEAARTAADAALDQYPFIADETQLKKGNTQ